MAPWRLGLSIAQSGRYKKAMLTIPAVLAAATDTASPMIWKAVGWLGNAVFFSRFLVQWYATERRKQVVVPAAFWWLSLGGALLLLAYAVERRDAVFVFAYAFTWIPYIRNLMIHHKHASAHRDCPGCGVETPPGTRFCSSCGLRISLVK